MKIPPSRRRWHFKKKGFSNYLDWILEEVGLKDVDKEIFNNVNNRKDLDVMVANLIPQEVEENDTSENIEDSVEEVIEESKEDEIEAIVEPEPEPEIKQVVPLVEQMFVPEEIDYNSMTVRELQEVCRERGITIRGTKADVVLRLRRNDEGLLGDTVDDETEAPSEEAVEVELDAPVEETAVTEGENNATDSEQGELIDKEE